MKEMKDIKKMINRANTLKEYDKQKQNSSKYFIVDDSIYNLSSSAIADIKANEKDDRVYFKDLKTSTLIEIADIK